MPELTWIGKSAVVGHHAQVPFRLLEEVPSLSCQAADGDTENLIVQDDNLAALKALLPRYAGQVKCIYIDPPYNTGNEGWVYNDAVNSPEIRQWLGHAVGREAEDLSRHDKWLCLMYPRLVLLRQFLRDDGAIFVSIDDNEVASLRLLMDEVFGCSHFIASIAWEKRYTRSNNAKLFYSLKDFIVVYRRSDTLEILKEPRTEKSDANYDNPDNDPRGPWMTASYVNPATKAQRPNLVYSLTNPVTGKTVDHPTHAWKYEREEHERHVRENRLWWGKSGEAKYPRLKLHLNEQTKGLVPVDIWTHEETGTTDDGGNEIKDIFGQAVFDTPKPTQLLQRILRLAADKDSLILDSFAGSGTTGHAVLALNQQDGGQRRFILVEIDEMIARDITAERVRRVAQGYTNAKGEPVAGLGGGFQFARLGKMLFDETGAIRADVTFPELAEFVFFKETGRPLPKASRGRRRSPLLGVHDGRAVYLLFNGILGDRTVNGGNVLTGPVLAQLPPHAGPKVIYAAAGRLGRARLEAERITFKQTPYDLQV
jgi:site-specific DNA-methyltransferase (adenine-specific)/adenine-specific DNA-methyltransferase